jgi:hypothetical protein
LALDVGAGSGRDAAWLDSLEHDVVAVEPAAGMRREGALRHPEARIRWLDDRLPDLTATHRLGLSFASCWPAPYGCTCRQELVSAPSESW